MVTLSQQRTASLKVNLVPHVYERLRLLADRQGMPAAVLASIAIGQYVSNHMAPIDMQEKLLATVQEVVDKLPQQLLEFEHGQKS
jgi:hypothetical protein